VRLEWERGSATLENSGPVTGSGGDFNTEVGAMSAKEIRDTSLRKPFLQNHPSELQERLLSALLERGERPLSSPELAKKVGLQTNSVRGYCEWLLRNGYVDRHLRKVIRIVDGHPAKKPTTFWSLLAKGEQCLAKKAADRDAGASDCEVMSG
jgi:hypothetical protein